MLLLTPSVAGSHTWWEVVEGMKGTLSGEDVGGEDGGGYSLVMVIKGDASRWRVSFVLGWILYSRGYSLWRRGMEGYYVLLVLEWSGQSFNCYL